MQPPPEPVVNGVNGTMPESKNAATPPNAIVGMACRLPGNVTTLEEFWQLCSRRRSAWSEVPKERFNAEGFYHPNPDRNGAISAQGGHFLHEDVGLFDAPFFNITLQEAIAMDPQQRLLLECTYEALENGGFTKAELAGRQVGVFVGCSPSDYEVNNYKDIETIPIQQPTGNSLAVLSNRISHCFDFNGPSFTVDTACSASLSAMHLACQSLRNGECSMAVVAGCHLNLLPDVFVSYSRSRLLSDSGRSYPFDHKASGFGRGEGVGCVILKPYQDALDDHDFIRALTVDTSINQDGRTRGIATPNPVAQAALMRTAYHNAGVDPSNTGYVEAHGTGTTVGDPLEASALYSVFGEGRTPKNPLLMGSVKSNIGHIEGASGIISVIKTAMMLQNGFVLPTCGFEKPNEKIPLSEWNMKVPTKQLPWPRGKDYASINNFGVGGSNAHVILKKPPPKLNPDEEQNMPNGVGDQIHKISNMPRRVIVLSANDRESALAQARNLRIFLEKNPDVYDPYLVSNLSYTLGQRRTHFPWRVALCGSLGKELIAELSRKISPSHCPEQPNLGFAFTGQGAQWYAMGRELMSTYAPYMQTLRTVDTILTSLGAKFSIVDELSKEETETCVSEAYMSQPACNAIQLALTELLRSWGVRPSAVVGHSSGEIAAAYAADILTLEQCVRIAYARGQAAQILADGAAQHKGAMMAVPASAIRVQPLLDAIERQGAVIACINSPSSVTVSGDEDAVDELQRALEKEGISARKLNVTVAYHSPHMRQVAQNFEDIMGEIEPRASTVGFYSTVTGGRIDGSELNQSYWVKNLLSRVSFSQGMRSLLADDDSDPRIKTLVEVGPHSVLQAPIKEIIGEHFSGQDIQYIPTLKRNKDATETIQSTAVALYTAGATIEFGPINPPVMRNGKKKEPQLLVNLPKYPWNHSRRYWHQSRAAMNHLHRKFPRNDILGSMIEENIDLEPRWRNIIRLDHHPWIRQHQIFGESVYPMAGFLSMAVEAVLQQASLNSIEYDHAEFRDITLDKLLIIPSSGQVETMLSLKACTTELHSSGNIWFEFHVYSWETNRGWEEHCHGFVSPQVKKQSNPVDTQDPTVKEALCVKEESCTQAVQLSQMYKNLAASGLSYGPLFQGFSELFLGDGNRARGSFEIPDTRKHMPDEYETGHIVHPISLDVCLQMIWPLCGFGKTGEHQLYFPASIKHLEISKHALSAGTHLDIRSQRSQSDNTTGAATQSFTMIDAKDPTNVPIKIDGCIVKPVSRASRAIQSHSTRSLCYKQVWNPCLDSVQERNNPVLEETETRDLEGEQRMRLLRHVALIYIERALEQIPVENVQRLRKHHQQLYKWMASARSKRETAIYGKDEREALIERTGALSYAGELVCKLGENLPGILSGKVRPLSLMPPGGLNRFFEDLDCYRQSHSNTVTIIDKLAHQNPNLNILEVGAGTASATLPILESIGGSGLSTRRCTQYTCTDISPAALEDAKTKLQAWDHLTKFKVLDISASPEGQGYKAHSYDLIIACNVLHSTPRVAQGLKNIKELLVPGGKLLLVEEAIMHPSLFGFATLPGWWLNEDMDRATGPLMEKKRWEESLLATGFSGIDLCLDDYPDSPEQTCCTMLATANDDNLEQEPAQPINKDVVIVQYRSTGVFPLEGLIDSVCNITRKAAVVTTLLHADVEGKLCIFLGEVGRTILADLTPEVFQALQRLLTRSAGVLWITGWGDGVQRPADLSICQGVSRTLRRETNSPIATLDLGDLRKISPESMVRMTTQVFRSISACQSAPLSGDMEYSVRNDQLCVPRFVEDSSMDITLQQETNQAPQLQKLQQTERPLTLATSESVPGGLHFTDDGTIAAPLPSDFVEVHVVSTGLNFKDIVISMGEVAGKNLGVESSGIITATGDRVQGLRVGDKVSVLAFGSLSTVVRCRAANVYKKPENMSMDLAASVPAVFCTAYYSLVELSRLQPDESVLIHSAAGGLGQAAIIIAQSIGATVFATVSTKEKKEYLVKTFNLNPRHIFFSRDTSFAERVLEATDGRGVDVLINSLPGDALRASFECVAPFGRFIELGKREIQRNARLGMLPFDKNLSYTAVDLALVMNHNPKLVQKLLRNVFEKIAGGVISLKQWPVTSYSVSEIDDAFRALRGGRTIGKLVIQMERNAMVKVHPARRPGQLLNPDAAYVIVGGTRGIGLEITPWMADKGARHFVLVSRSGAQTPEAHDIIDSLTARGVKVDLCQCDIARQEDVGQQLVPLLKRVPRVGGVIFGPMILRDVMFEKMTYDDFQTVINPRVHGLWNVHNTLLSLNQRGDFFINLSSVSSTIGNLTQAAYAASGTFMAAFEEHRAALGLPCSTIELAPVSGVGFAARDEKTQEQVTNLFGNEWIDLNDIQGLFAAAIRGDMKQSCSNHCITGLGGAKEPSAERLFWTKDPRFSHLLGRSTETASSANAQASTATAQASLADTISSTEDPETIISTIGAAFVQKLSGILMIPAEEIDPMKPISAFGLDSLVAIEVRYWINSELQANLQLLEILTADSVFSLALVIVCQSSIIEDGLKATCREHFEKSAAKK